jgi:hypothetical protein
VLLYAYRINDVLYILYFCWILTWSSIIVLQTDKGDEELCSVYVPTNHLYIGDIFLVNSAEIIRPNLSILEGICLLF